MTRMNKREVAEILKSRSGYVDLVVLGGKIMSLLLQMSHLHE